MSRRTLARPEQSQQLQAGLPATHRNLFGSMGALLLRDMLASVAV